jgi:pilus assembly protein CpaF
LVSVQEITGMEGNVITMQEIFGFQQTRVDSEGRSHGHFKFHGVRPKFMDRFKAVGIDAIGDLFDPSRIVEV